MGKYKVCISVSAAILHCLCFGLSVFLIKGIIFGRYDRKMNLILASLLMRTYFFAVNSRFYCTWNCTVELTIHLFTFGKLVFLLVMV